MVLHQPGVKVIEIRAKNVQRPPLLAASSFRELKITAVIPGSRKRCVSLDVRLHIGNDGGKRPPGKSPNSCPAVLIKIFRFLFSPNHRHHQIRPAPSEGRLAIVTKRGAGCGGRDRRLIGLSSCKNCFIYLFVPLC